jgi:hypothetical protein
MMLAMEYMEGGSLRAAMQRPEVREALLKANEHREPHTEEAKVGAGSKPGAASRGAGRWALRVLLWGAVCEAASLAGRVNHTHNTDILSGCAVPCHPSVVLL